MRSVCTNDTDCNMIWNKYKIHCNRVILWDHNTTMPTCTDQCKKRIEELENNPIGKYMKCCGCDQENEEEKMDCITERQNVAIVCDVDFNHVNNCHNNLELCVNDTFEKHENSDRLGRYCVVIELFSVGKVSFYYTDSADNPLACFGWKNKCTDDKCCRKAYDDAFYYCYNVSMWRNNSRNIVAPVCSDRCANALGVLYNDHIGKNLRCCKSGILSEINQNNLTTLKVMERINNARRNLENICKISHTQGCNDDQLLDTFQSKNMFSYVCSPPDGDQHL